MTVTEQLRSQNWERISVQLTSFAYKFTRRRSWEHAEDLAQQAIAQAYDRIDGWDPAREPLLKNLTRRVVGLATNSWRHKKNTFEISMGLLGRQHESDGEDADNGDSNTLDMSADLDGAEDVLDRRRLAETFRTRLLHRLAGDEIALSVLELFVARVVEPGAQATALGIPPPQIASTRRRVFRHAEAVSEELSLELDSENDPEESHEAV